MKTPNNPPAFPLESPNEHRYQPGMTLRDWFAGQALAGFSGSSVAEIARSGAAKRAEWAYVEADAMLVQREKQP